MNVEGAIYAILAAGVGALGFGLADVTALVVAFGTLAAGLVHARRLKLDRPKVLEEVTTSVQSRLEQENALAWRTVDALRKREEALEEELDTEKARRRKLERECRSLELRVDELERIVDAHGLGGVQPGH